MLSPAFLREHGERGKEPQILQDVEGSHRKLITVTSRFTFIHSFSTRSAQLYTLYYYPF